MTTRLALLRASARRPRRARTTQRTGHVKSTTTAEKRAANTAKNDPATAKPAPGPM